MWQGGQHLHATQTESRAQNKQMTAIGYILDMQEIVKALWLLFQHDGVAAFKLSETSPLPPSVSAESLPGGHTQILNVHRMRKINRHRVESEEGNAPESIADTEKCRNWNGNLNNPNVSEGDCAADTESDTEQDIWVEDPECPELRDVSAAPNVPRLIRSTQKSIRQAEKVFVTVNAIEQRRNK